MFYAGYHQLLRLGRLNLDTHGSAMPRLCRENEVDIVALKPAQKEVYALLLAQLFEGASKHDRVFLHEKDADKLAVTAVKRVDELGDLKCQALLQAEKTLKSSLPALAEASLRLAEISAGPTQSADLHGRISAFAENLVRATRAMDTLVGGLMVDTDTDQGEALTESLVDYALRGLTRERRDAIRQVLTNPDGPVATFVRAARSAQAEADNLMPGQLQPSLMRANIRSAVQLLEKTLAKVGSEQDAEVLRTAASKGWSLSELGRLMRDEVLFSFLPKTYDPDSIDSFQIFGNNDQLREDFLHYADTRSHSTEYREFVNLAREVAANPSLDGLRSLSRLRDDLNLSAGSVMTFTDKLNAMEAGRETATPENLSSALETLRTAVVATMEDIMMRFRSHIKNNTFYNPVV